MIKTLRRAISFIGRGTKAGETTIRSTQTCTECGSKLMPSVGGDELHESQTETHPLPKNGDSCNSSFRSENANWLCPNPDCPAQVRRGLVHWCAPEVMDIPGGDAPFVAKLVGQGLVRDVAELYRLKAKELAALPGENKESAQTFFAAITASMNRDAWRVLFGLNISLVGAAEAQTLGKGYATVDAVFAAGVPRLMQDGGVSEAVAQSIVRWYSDSGNRQLVKRLEKLGVNFKSELYCAAAAKGPRVGRGAKKNSAGGETGAG